MMYFNFNHIALAVKDVSISVAFYKAVFNLGEIENTASKSKTRWLEFEDGRQLHLIPRPAHIPTIIKATHFALSTSQLDDFVTHLEKINLEYSDWINSSDKSFVREDGIRQIYFQDPDGYWIEVNNDT